MPVPHRPARTASACTEHSPLGCLPLPVGCKPHAPSRCGKPSEVSRGLEMGSIRVLACHRSRPRERLGADATLLPSSTHIPLRLCLFLSFSPPPIVGDDWLHRRLRRRILCTLVLHFEDVLPGSCSLEADKVGSFVLPPQNWSC